MPPFIQIALESWTLPIPLTLTLLVAGYLYARGWFHLRSVSVNAIPAWRAASFLLGLFFVWAAIGSPLAAFDEELLTAHMIQHLLLMTFAPVLILLGAPVMPFLHGLPQVLVRNVLGPLFRWPLIQLLGRSLTQPAFCWLASAAALVGWHIPAVFTLALHSDALHILEHASFLSAGFLFWWPVVQPWPSISVWPRWSILLYLFFATLPCDILSGFLVFSERIVYSAYLASNRPFGISALEDQECAGALMWTCITIVYLVSAAILTTRLLTVRNSARQAQMHSNVEESYEARANF
jgi:cytochrome c oxidase assembly factor CtaG